jgi:hypothetical protein
MSDGLVFPQHGDEGDAAFFAFLAGTRPETDGIISGFEITNVDFTTDEVTVGRGKAILTQDTMTSVATNVDPDKTVDGAVRAIQYPGQSEISIPSSGINELYLNPRFNQSDDPHIQVNPATTTDKLKVGEVDVSAQTVSEQWNVIQRDGTLSYPDIDSAKESISTFSDGVSVYVRDRERTFIVKSGELRSRGTGLSDGLIATNETVIIRANERESVGGTVTVNGTLTVDGQTVLHGPISGDGVITGDGTVGLTDAISDSVEPIEPDISTGIYQMLSGWTTENTTSDSDSFDAYQFPINSALEVEQNESLTFEKQ